MKDAVMMQAKILDSVIKEESEEHLTTSDGGNLSENGRNSYLRPSDVKKSLASVQSVEEDDESSENVY